MVQSRRRVSGALRRSRRRGLHRLLKRLSEESKRAGTWLEVPCVSWRAMREWRRAAPICREEVREPEVEVNLVFMVKIGLIVDCPSSLIAKKMRMPEGDAHKR